MFNTTGEPGTATATKAQALAAHADAIRTIGRRIIADVIEIGKRLVEAKGLVGHGGWLPWLNREFGWSDKTAENFMNVHRLTKFEKFSNLADLTIDASALYLLAAPSTPDEARDAVIERAKAGETITVAETKRVIAEAKGRSQRPALLREMKLGEDVVAKIRGTALGKARELDELIVLNRGAPPGGVTPVVAQPVAEAAAGKHVSALAATAHMWKQLARRTPVEVPTRDDIGPASRGEVERLEARIEEQNQQLAMKDRQLAAKDRHFEEELALKDRHIAALEREIRELRARKRHDGGGSVLKVGKVMSGRELEHRARNADSAQLAILQNELQSGNVPVHKFTLEQARQLVPLRARHEHKAA
jgi:hypothetical protein